MKFVMFLFASLASSAWAQAPVDEETARPSICETGDIQGGPCYTLALQGPPVRIASTWNLRLIDVKDSRCPTDVDCVWEGFVTATFRLDAYPSISSSETVVLSLDRRNPAGNVWMDKRKGLKIKLENVTPLKIGRPPMPTRYYAQVRVSRMPWIGNPPVNCPTLERPAICFYGDIEVNASNRCLALAELKQTLQEQNVNYDPEAIQCEDLTRALAE